jgi:hypothetical protein
MGQLKHLEGALPKSKSVKKTIVGSKTVVTNSWVSVNFHVAAAGDGRTPGRYLTGLNGSRFGPFQERLELAWNARAGLKHDAS